MTEQELKMGGLVRNNREFSGVRKGSLGKIVSKSNSWPDTDSVAIEWQDGRWPRLVDWFSFDDLRYLDAVEKAK